MNSSEKVLAVMGWLKTERILIQQIGAGLDINE
jgi:hypothetical protein